MSRVMVLEMQMCGFGYLKSDEAKNYITKIVKQIEEYDGENWIDKYE